MKDVFFIAFRLGGVAPEPLSRATQEHYLWLGRAILNDECRTAHRTSPSCIPISNKTIQTNSSQIYTLFSDAIGQAANSELIVVDLYSPGRAVTRGTLLFHLAIGIAAWGSSIQAGPNPRMVLLLPELPPNGDELLKHFSPMIDSGKLVIIDDDGNSVPMTPSLRPEQHRVGLLAARGQPMDLLKRKMIKRFGHFHRNAAKPEYCVPFFYDGRFCESELFNLFQGFIDNLQLSSIEDVIILYHGTLSPWIQNTATAVATKRNVLSLDLADPQFETFFMQKRWGRAIVFLDVVDTGGTLKAIVNNLQRLDHELTLHILTVLTTEISDKVEQTRTLTAPGLNVAIKCLLLVAQQKTLTTDCDMCRRGLPFNKHNEEDDLNEPLMLRSYHFWSMLSPFGLKREEDIPGYRGGLERVPDLLKVIDENAAWIVNKIRQQLEVHLGGLPSDAVLLCPDEKGAEMLTEQLKLILGFSAIRIPRDVINQCAKNDGNLLALKEQWSLTNPRWHSELSSTPKHGVMVIDEFNASGNTLKGLTELLTVFGKTLECFITLLDFNPRHTRSQIKNTQIPIISLYEIQNFSRDDTSPTANARSAIHS